MKKQPVKQPRNQQERRRQLSEHELAKIAGGRSSPEYTDEWSEAM
jgi:bacteriocin-like protein